MKTPITYYGGKQNLLKHILPLIPEHKLYTEAFCGGASVFFAKKPAKAEIINDINGHLVNFYKILKSDYNALKIKVEQTLYARDEHSQASHILEFPDFFTPIDRAWAVWAMSKMSYAANLSGMFGYGRDGSRSTRLRNAKMTFCEELSQRLEHATIENRPALKVLEMYDCEGAWHFVDPPYVGTDCGHYDGFFGRDDLSRLLDLLKQVKGKFMLTMFPNDEIAEYAERLGWVTHRVERTISASGKCRRKQEEWIVCNYENPKSDISVF